MLRTQDPAVDLQGLALKRLGLRILTLPKRSDTKAPCRNEGFRIVRPFDAPVQSQRKLKLPARLRVQPEVEVGLPDGVSNRGLHLRLLAKLSRDSRRRPVESRPHFQVWIGFGRRAGLAGCAGLCQQIILKEVAHG